MKECLWDECDGRSPVGADHVTRVFLDKQELVSQYDHAVNNLPEVGSTIARTLWQLKMEMIQLMHCDVLLWKQLTDLNASITTLKEDFRNAALYRPRFGSFKSSSSDTESFISAQEYTDINYINSTHNRVVSWVNQCDQGETSAHVGSDINTRPRSPPCDDKESTVNGSTSLRKALVESCIIEIHNTFINLQNTGRSWDWHGDFYSRDLSPSITGIAGSTCTMKTVEDRDILARCSLTCYKSSLRLLGSVRMQSRIFETNLTKRTPLALLNGVDSYIISPPTPFSNIRPRQKLHRLCNFVFNKPVEVTDATILNENSENDYCEGKHKSEVESNGCEIRENAEQAEISKDVHSNTKTETYEQLYSENSKTRTQLKVHRSDSGYSEEFGNTSDKEIDISHVSGTEIDPFSSKFLDIKDGLITCRILYAEAEEQKVTKTPVDEEELEFLVIVDGKVTFSPHIHVADQEEPYYLKWLFGGEECELSDSCFTHFPCHEGNHDRNDENDSYFISRLFEDDSETETDILGDEHDNSFLGDLFLENDAHIGM